MLITSYRTQYKQSAIGYIFAMALGGFMLFDASAEMVILGISIGFICFLISYFKEWELIKTLHWKPEEDELEYKVTQCWNGYRRERWKMRFGSIRVVTIYRRRQFLGDTELHMSLKDVRGRKKRINLTGFSHSEIKALVDQINIAVPNVILRRMSLLEYGIERDPTE
ncbi:hypothetical protein GCM10007907_12160 [Chitinimonas prasina]|uniref:PH domain-containing protein n=1 Tax=Chitinimonas prasina TaxID=1434937 RepID=A0ABQ5YBV2_9NEIS|nr:hypothetical protein [Chitinimonas prasina]GLR12426.1 hypothetical protein GCM10007907_12160 [Chitinimonas prasina]